MRLYNLVLWAAILLLLENKGQLLLEINNIETFSGSLQVAVYNSEKGFLKNGDEFMSKVAAIKSRTTLQITIPDLPFGKYAIAVYHDINDNGELDKNYLGIPIEPYAFSNNPKVKWRSPTFAETQVELNAEQKNLRMELKRWRKH